MTSQPRPRPFSQVDVFTATPYRGNPVAVVRDAVGLGDEQMAAFARWTNLSETTFLLPPSPEGAAAGADYRLRIFTPAGELPFAGHPTLGSCHAWLAGGGTPREAGVVVQECGIGLVALRRSPASDLPDGGASPGGRLAFAAPDLLTDEPLDPSTLAAITRALGLEARDVVDHRFLDNGPGWRVLLLGSADKVLALDPDFSGLGDLAIGVVGPYTALGDGLYDGPDGAAVEVRGYALDMGIPEDPVTGSLNAVVGQWLQPGGLLPAEYVASQGTALGRAGRVHVSRRDDGDGATVWVGGDAVTCIEGTVLL
ncbi:PhzF family phenazine biosynthesis protein [Oerskovia sp. Sa1BUA8]|uniref:PhzF family phenazine biosynthesis protein n=1 Tax=Oerskovia douganii TaxID=2762210 RepID=A0A9D5UKS7_9CELL|nr:PhzF family phenazine biosynthesis protein [Oerskovia douganii]MBE7702327.1 PhzF family phenazine biosynthesis protein [Oerskovia douganii]